MLKALALGLLSALGIQRESRWVCGPPEWGWPRFLRESFGIDIEREDPNEPPLRKPLSICRSCGTRYQSAVPREICLTCRDAAPVIPGSLILFRRR